MNHELFFQENQQFFNSIAPLSEEEKKEVEAEMKNGFRAKLKDTAKKYKDNISRAIGLARRKKMCPAIGTCKQAVADYNTYILKKTLELPQKPQKQVKFERFQLMQYKDAAKLVFVEIQAICPNFVIDDLNRDILQNLTKYFINDESCTFNLDKGVCLAGGIGSGKTTILKAMSNFTIKNNLDTAFMFESFPKIIRQVSSEGLAYVDNFTTGNICFDDVGTRSSVKSYGTDINPFDELIHTRYERFVRSKKPTHLTTNLDFNPEDQNAMNQLLTMYDARAIDRIKEMSNFVYLGGESRRK